WYQVYHLSRVYVRFSIVLEKGSDLHVDVTLDLVAPDVPPFDRLPGEKLDIRTGRDPLDHPSKLCGLLGVSSTGGQDEGPGLHPLAVRRPPVARTSSDAEQAKFMLRPEILAHGVPVGLAPADVRDVAEPPRLHDPQAVEEHT